MARNGYKIFDADTHVRPDAELLEPYLAAAARAKLAQYEKYQGQEQRWRGHVFNGRALVQAPTGFSRRRSAAKKRIHERL